MEMSVISLSLCLYYLAQIQKIYMLADEKQIILINNKS